MDDTLLSFPNFHEDVGELVADAETKSILTTEPNTVSGDDFAIPLVPDEEDDFSWLFKILPTTSPPHAKVEANHTVPQPGISDYANEAQAFIGSPATMLDPLLSETQITLDIVHQVDATPKVPPRQRRQRRKTIEVPVPTEPAERPMEPPPLRRSLRKRSYHEMAKTDLKSTSNTPPAPATTLVKRKKLEVSQEEVTSEVTAEKGAVSSPKSENNKIEELEKKPGSELKIILRRCPPVNPIPDLKLSNNQYRRFLLDPRRQLAGELYLMHATLPQTTPGAFEGENMLTLAAIKPLDRVEIKTSMRMQHLRAHNRRANLIAHSNLNPASRKKVNPNSIPTFDLDKQYDELVRAQEALHSILKSEAVPSSSHSPNSEESNKRIMDNSRNLPNNISTHTDPELQKECHPHQFSGITGAVPVRGLEQDFEGEAAGFLSKWSIFAYQGQYYRPNPVVVTLVRITEEEINDFLAAPTKPSQIRH